MQEKWEDWKGDNKEIPTFAEFINMSVLWMYVKGKYDDFQNEDLKSGSFADITDERWREINREKAVSEDEKIEFIDLKSGENIPDLIECRGRCILALCRGICENE